MSGITLRLATTTFFAGASLLLAACGGGGGGDGSGGNGGDALPLKWDAPAAPFAEPKDDPFYAAPPQAQLDGLAPGSLLRYREISVVAYRALPVAAKAWQLMFRSTDTQGDAVASVTTLLVPDNAPAEGRVLLSYQTAYDGLTNRCAPSYNIIRGEENEHAAFLQGLLRGWVVVIGDYEGLEAQWIAGINTGRGVLDGIRAVLRFEPSGLAADAPVALWGYSGGGYATLWGAELQRSYAPELNLKGVAAGGAPADIGGSARNLDGGPFAGVYFGAVVGLSRAYPEFDFPSYLNDAGKAMVADIGDKCVNDFIVGSYSFHRMSEYVNVPELLDLPLAQQVLAANRLGQRTPAAPLYYYHAVLDYLNPSAEADALMAKYCAEGLAVNYEKVIAGEHITPVATSALTAIGYLSDRIAGLPAPSNCGAAVNVVTPGVSALPLP